MAQAGSRAAGAGDLSFMLPLFGGRGAGFETITLAKPSKMVTGKQDITRGQQGGSEEGVGLSPARPGGRNGNAFQDLEIGPAGPRE